MSMDIGSILVCGDYKGDLRKIANVLGRLISYCPGDESAFQVDENESKLDWNGECWGLVTIDPERHLLKLNDNRRIYADEADELTLKQWKADRGGSDCEECDLETVSRLVSPLLTSGTIELVSFTTIQCLFISYGRLIIRSNGSVALHGVYSASRLDEGWTQCISDRYDPDEMGLAA
jgi:hypothetical protein